MNLFYNPEGVGDVAFLQLEPVTGPVNYDKKGNVVTLYQEDQVVGFNIFEASKAGVEGNGHIKLTEDLVNAFQQQLDQAFLKSMSVMRNYKLYVVHLTLKRSKKWLWLK